MPAFEPFRGVRYDTAALGDPLDAVVAPPYDVIDDDLLAALEHRHARNSVRLILPRDVAEVGDGYQAARRAYEDWLTEGSLVPDPHERFYGYRMSFRDPDGAHRTTLGVLGALELPTGDPAASGILPHEQTMPKAKSDRLELLRATRANLDPIWLLSTARGLTDLVAHGTQGAELDRCTDADGVEHVVFAIDDQHTQQAIGELVASAPLVLADGHHRFETACAYRTEVADTVGTVGAASAILALVVELAEEQLSIQPIHRLVELDPRQPLDVRDALSGPFDIRDEVDSNDPDTVRACYRHAAQQDSIVLVDAHGCALLVPRDVSPVRDDWPATVAGTDAAIVESLAVPSLTGASWRYRHDAIATAALVEKGEADAALLLQPVSVTTTRAASVAGDRMPPKTTFFYPKPRTGLVFRAFDTVDTVDTVEG